ncbi:MAG TPA: isoprenylcysteine carboxylmethyltransferase family protein [Actinomycetota bacterium]|nr:isoprenylcysteine carboxylmethyltransferase family protein [Actinomycetota bacterium]
MTRLPALGPRGEGWVLAQSPLLVIVVAAGWFLGPDWSGPLRIIGVVIGVFLMVAGLGLIARAIANLGDGMTPMPRPVDDGKLVVTGAFGLVRHPIYSGIIAFAFGWAIARASVMAMAWATVLLAFFYLKSVREEAWLETKYPGYAAYRARTPRFIPWIGRSGG